METNQRNIALVTGATGGLGTAMCQKLKDDGYFVVANYRNAEKAKVWQEKEKEKGYEFAMVEGDVTHFEDTGRMMAEIKAKYGPVSLSLIHI